MTLSYVSAVVEDKTFQGLTPKKSVHSLPHLSTVLYGVTYPFQTDGSTGGKHFTARVSNPSVFGTTLFTVLYCIQCIQHILRLVRHESLKNLFLSLTTRELGQLRESSRSDTIPLYSGGKFYSRIQTGVWRVHCS